MLEVKPELEAWHFLPNNKKLRYDDNRIPKKGEWLKYKRTRLVGPTEGLRLCKVGMHASVCLADAVMYGKGLHLCRVELGGDVIRGLDKVCATYRRVVWMIDLQPLVKERLMEMLTGPKPYKSFNVAPNTKEGKAFAALRNKALAGTMTKKDIQDFLKEGHTGRYWYLSFLVGLTGKRITMRDLRCLYKSTEECAKAIRAYYKRVKGKEMPL